MKNQPSLAKTFSKINDNYTVTNCHNGFVIEISGQDDQDIYRTERFIFNTMTQLQTAVQDISSMPRS